MRLDGGLEEREELRYSLRRTSVQSLRRCWSDGDLPCNTTSHVSLRQPSLAAKKIPNFLSQCQDVKSRLQLPATTTTTTQTPHPQLPAKNIFFSQVFLDILVVPVVPAARPVPGIPEDPQLPLGPRLPSAHRSPGVPPPHSPLSEEAGSSNGNRMLHRGFVFQRKWLHDRK